MSNTTTASHPSSTIGHPSSFTEQVASEFCCRIITGQSIRTICADDDMPDASTIFNWLSKFPAFAQQYARATTMRAHARFERIDDVILDMRNDIIDSQKARVEIDAIKWQCGKEAPSVYGEQIKVEHSGTVGVLSVAEILRQREDAVKAQAEAALTIDTSAEVQG